MGTYDVVVVGSGPAGCTVATLLGRVGLRVALVESHRDPAYHKRLCTHFIQSSALPVLERLGVTAAMDAAGAVRNRGSMWTRYGWVREPGGNARRPAHGYNLRRAVLDPLLRERTAGTPGVDLLTGAKATGLTRDPAGRVDGVVVTTDGVRRELRARLVVGADGRSSKVADLADLPARSRDNARCGYFAQFRGVTLPAAGSGGQMWQRPPEAVYAFPNEDGITVLVAMLGKDRLPEFGTGDREKTLLRTFEGLPDGPDLTSAVRVSPVLGVKDYPSLTRRHVVAPGVALVGDAALVGDPLWGVGYGWALQSGQWLVDAVAAALHHGSQVQVDRALRRYQWQHRRRLLPHQALLVDASTGRDFNPLERLLFSAGAADPRVADRVWAFGTRNASPLTLLSPVLLTQAMLARRSRSRVGLSGCSSTWTS